MLLAWLGLAVIVALAGPAWWLAHRTRTSDDEPARGRDLSAARSVDEMHDPREVPSLASSRSPEPPSLKSSPGSPPEPSRKLAPEPSPESDSPELSGREILSPV